jgi:hypothetical protein
VNGKDFSMLRFEDGGKIPNLEEYLSEWKPTPTLILISKLGGAIPTRCGVFSRSHLYVV